MASALLALPVAGRWLSDAGAGPRMLQEDGLKTNPTMASWLFGSILVLMLLSGLFVVRRDIRKRTRPADLRRVSHGQRAVECGSCHAVQAIGVTGRVFVCFQCSAVNRLPEERPSWIWRHRMVQMMEAQGPLRKFHFKREGVMYFHEIERTAMTEEEEAAWNRSEEASRPCSWDPSAGVPCKEEAVEVDVDVDALGPAVYGRGTGDRGLPMCVVCLDAEGSVVMLPCAHGGVCEECATKIAQNESRGGANCPHCRSSIELLVRLHASNADTASGIEVRVPMAI